MSNAGSSLQREPLCPGKSQESRHALEIPISIEHRSEDGGQKLESVFGLHDNHVKHAITRLIRMRERDIELNLREINDEHAQAFGFVAFAIDGYRDFRSLRNNIATRGQEIRDSTRRISCSEPRFP